MFHTIYRHRVVRQVEKLAQEMILKCLVKDNVKWKMEYWLTLDDMAIFHQSRAMPEYACLLNRRFPDISREEHDVWLGQQEQFIDQVHQLKNIHFI